ncbi:MULTISPECIES: hypothetical protein [unclassified Streptomyces]|uniref:hypothetical protein n=1 Tax=unclassified Streptomyces TaxID=2593676 RepID=UPI0023650B91|nr:MULTISPECIES: hypothetical protein [unclassified Streptomyces]MDF3145223.1 hypothetical protein [Streptomyces sp. T21Q-yed]WDF42439.1 hypothetical protein PBV52_39400 [Streptomyces sp. T12]
MPDVQADDCSASSQRSPSPLGWNSWNSAALTLAAGLEQLEQLRMRDHRAAGPPGRRRG